VNSDVTFSHDYFDILYIFSDFVCNQKRRFTFFYTSFAKKKSNSNLLISPNSRLRNIHESQKIYFLNFLSFSFLFYGVKKGDPWGGGWRRSKASFSTSGRLLTHIHCFSCFTVNADIMKRSLETNPAGSRQYSWLNKKSYHSFAAILKYKIWFFCPVFNSNLWPLIDSKLYGSRMYKWYSCIHLANLFHFIYIYKK
jgi:hypothetical protein